MKKEPKCRPIPFSSAMVFALLAGRKTQTRRMLKVQPAFDFPVRYDGPCFDDPLYHYWEQLKPDGETPTEKYHKLGRCPYGAPGDRLWVREMWRVENCLDDDKPSEIPSHYPVDYRADGRENWMHPGFAGRWRSARYMPRWASRITLELLKVRVERLQEVSEADAIAEGIETTCPCAGGCDQHRKDYAALWDSLHGDKPGERWKDNPWVWVLSFKRVETAVTE